MTNSALPTRKEIEAITSRVLAENPDAVVRTRLLRDVLGMSPNNPEFVQARSDLSNSQQIQLLEGEQRGDGSWGQFHSRDSRSKQKIITTEVGVERALALGLDASHPILQRTASYIIDIMEGRKEFPDCYEKNDRWALGMRLFLSSTLSLIHPEQKILDQDRKLWLEIAKRTFQSGNYSAGDEIKAHAEMTGASVKDSYLVLANRYTLNILGSTGGLLPVEVERSLLSWLWHRPEGIIYLGVPLSKDPPINMPGKVDRWLVSLEYLARLFPLWEVFAKKSLVWIWDQRNEAGFWDFGPRPSHLTYLPLSDHWRKPKHRTFDWTTRILVLLTHVTHT